MCGIVGYVGPRQATDVLMDGLALLEYRGYDSAGVAINDGERLEVIKAAGKLCELDDLLKIQRPQGQCGIGHTRWATHGLPNEINAHPHVDCTGDIAVVHNGIIENYRELREALIRQGHTFVSETDTEVVAHLIEHYLKAAGSGKADELEESRFLQAIAQALGRLRGAYALAVVHRAFPHTLVAARKESPLIIGCGRGEHIIASDIPAVLEYTRDIAILHDGELVLVHPDDMQVYNFSLEMCQPEMIHVDWDLEVAQKSGYEHFMLKEIFEQPQMIHATIAECMKGGCVQLSELSLSDEELRNLHRIFIVACGTSYHAGLVAKTLIERWAHIPVEVVASSEFRYGQPLIDEHTLVVAITQSGETADTLTGVIEARHKGAKALAITNVVGSRVTREADGVIYTHAGLEMGVAATKTFTTQIAALTILALKFAQVTDVLTTGKIEAIYAELLAVPQLVERVLEQAADIKVLAELFDEANSALFLGRGIAVPIALEGALKLKEISYIHAEAYPAGEMKHGPIALITDQVPVVAVATKSVTVEKTLSNVAEARTRRAPVLIVGTEGDARLVEYGDHIITVPETSELLSPIVSVIPLQLLSYYVTLRHGYDPDKPRNLAKSVTVE